MDRASIREGAGRLPWLAGSIGLRRCPPAIRNFVWGRLENPACANVATAEVLGVEVVVADTVCARGRMDELAVFVVDSDVGYIRALAEENEIAGAKLIAVDVASGARLLVGRPGKPDTDAAEHAEREPRAVHAVRG